ncbi:MAG: ChaN family lipoprotein [Burkholderiaceae bacterium]|nr:ChaN family lipoprotein [Burkholderiaceae bacterium]
MNCRHPVIALLLPAILLAACATAPPGTAERIAQLPAADVMLLGEQHDAPEHQRIERDVIKSLAASGRLGAVAIEMAEQGASTANVKRSAGEDEVRDALHWDENAWPWLAYGPAVMAAVRAGVPVVGANLPRAGLRDAMADASLDGKLPGPALKAQQQAIRLGHCGLLPEGQIAPMTRMQIARDMAMARTLADMAVPGKTTVMLSGSAHADRSVGVPLHLPESLTVHSVRLLPDGGPTGPSLEKFDTVWSTRPAPERDYCAELQRTRPPPPQK